MRSSSKPLLSTAAAIVAVISLDAYAAVPPAGQTATSTLTVTASVPPVCVVTNATLAFGPYSPVAPSDASANTTFTVACTQNTAYSVSANTGSNPSGNTRRMSDSAGAYLSYELYTDAAYSTVWNTSGTFTGVAASIVPISLTVYGVIPKGQDVPVASYSDTVAITVAF